MMKIIYIVVLPLLSATLSSAQTQWVLQEYLRHTGKNANEYLGTFVKGIGDLNGDGKPDIAVSDGSPVNLPSFSQTGIWYPTNIRDF